MSKYKIPGTPLTQQEMKNVKGGEAPPPKTLWYCLIEPGYYDYVCYWSQPRIPCNYSQDCVAYSTCTGNDVCIS